MCGQGCFVLTTCVPERLCMSVPSLLKIDRASHILPSYPDVVVKDKKTYGFKTYKTAPQSKELAEFEKDLANLVANVKFTNYRSPFQQQLRKDVCAIQKNENLLIQADKTTNIYKVQGSRFKVQVY